MDAVWYGYTKILEHYRGVEGVIALRFLSLEISEMSGILRM
jgi:hypothetical protein